MTRVQTLLVTTVLAARRSPRDGNGPEFDEFMRPRDVVVRQDGLHEDSL